MRDQFDHYLNMTPVTGHSLFNSRFLFALLLIYGYAMIILNSSIEGGRAPSEVIVTNDKRQYDLALGVKRISVLLNFLSRPSLSLQIMYAGRAHFRDALCRNSV